jgi:hypothetical protein
MKTYDLPKKLADAAMREADRQIRANHARGIFDEGDPNHPMYNNGINYVTGLPVSLFGYEPRGFLARQYKGTK